MMCRTMPRLGGDDMCGARGYISPGSPLGLKTSRVYPSDIGYGYYKYPFFVYEVFLYLGWIQDTAASDSGQIRIKYYPVNTRIFGSDTGTRISGTHFSFFYVIFL